MSRYCLIVDGGCKGKVFSFNSKVPGIHKSYFYTGKDEMWIVDNDDYLIFDNLDEIGKYILGVWEDCDAYEDETKIYRDGMKIYQDFIENHCNDSKIKPSDIKRVQFDEENRKTIVFFNDETKSVVVAYKGDEYNKEMGLAMALLKHYCKNAKEFSDIFKKWIPEEFQ